MALKRKPGSRRSARTQGIHPWEPTADQVAIYRRWCAGTTQSELANELSISQANLSKLCAKVEAWLVARTIDDVRGLKLRQTVRLEKYIEELEAAWERSKQDAVTETIEGVKGEIRKAAKKSAVRPQKIKTMKSGQCGQSAYLEAAMSALDRIRKIWGADAPLKIETFGEPRVAGMERSEAKIVFLERKLEEEKAARQRQLEPHPN